MPNPEDAIPEELIRKRSYQIWERENRPKGKDLDHWMRAKEELRAERRRRVQGCEIPVGQQKTVYYWDHCG